MGETLKQRLKNHETVFGTFYKLNSPIATEMLGWAGMDFIVIDCEHGAISSESVENIVRCADSTGMSTVVRVASDAEEHILHALDSGAEGVQIPDLKTVEQFKRSAAACKYYPLGTRGLSRGTRSLDLSAASASGTRPNSPMWRRPMSAAWWWYTLKTRRWRKRLMRFARSPILTWCLWVRLT